jgi:cytochrome oxidase Cu insertion factor (SCO1/SenC/PrrC family)/thiol-disulfide isomerase/thioredoxin
LVVCVTVAVVAGAVFVGLSVALRIHATGASGVGPASSGRNLAPGVRVDRPVPRVHLVDERGRSTTLSSLQGKWVVLAPSMTLCHEVCPLTTAALERLGRLMSAAGDRGRFVAVEVTVDPWRDTPRRLRAYRRLTGADFPLLTGSTASVRRLWRFFGVNFEKVPEGNPPDRDWMTGKPERFDIEHTDGAFVIDPSGRERLAIPGMAAVGGRVAASLKRLLDEEGMENLHDPTPGWSAVDLARRMQRMMGPSPRTPASAGAVASSPGNGLRSGKSLGEGLEALRGRPALVNVWASWCPPCREEVPLLAAAERRFGRRIAFVGADLEDDEGSARGFLRRAGSDYPSFPVDAGEVGDLLGPAQGTPLTFFLDAAGEVVDEHIGAYDSAAELDADLIRHLADD